MRIYRGPRIGGDWNETDSKKPAQILKDWEPGGVFRLSGTINKAGDRHTELGLVIEEDDVVAMVRALIKQNQKDRKDLERANERIRKDLAESRAETEALRDVFNKLYSLTAFYSDEAPSQEELIRTVEQIASTHRYSWSSNKPPKIDWIEWGDI